RGGATAALPVPNSVLRFVGKIGVRWPKFFRDLCVVLRPRVFVAYEDRDWSAESFSVENSGENFAAVLLLPLCCDIALTRPAALQLPLNLRFAEINFRRAAINHDADAAAVRFAKSRDTKKLSKRVAHCVTQLSWL